MDRKWVFIVGIVIIIIVASISFMSITETTGSFIYGKCWNIKDLNEENEIALEVQGCVVERSMDRVCCPFEECPEIDGVIC